jgi:predicted DCC family thiol-disulfide oxidoreductase YuxK
MPPEPAAYLLYDGECPVCQNFIAMTQLRAVRPDIEICDARKEPELVALVRSRGIEINDAMYLKLGDTALHGAAAMALISRLSAPNSWLTSWLLGVVARDRVITPMYPVLVVGRKALLFLLGRHRIP